MILVCGEALVDMLVTPRTGGLSSLDVQLAGAPFNLAVGLARLGCRVVLFSGVSTDPLGEAFVERLAAEGIDGSFLQRSDAATMLAVVGVGRDGHPAYRFPIVDGADKQLSVPAFSPAMRRDLSAAIFGSYLAMIEPVASLMREMARVLQPDMVICLDPNVRSSIVAEAETWRRGIAAFLPLTDILKASEEDIHLAYGPGADSAVVARDWLSQGPALVVVTRGPHGALAVLRTGETVVVDAPPVSVTDTVGAGDAFFAGLIDSLWRQDVLSRDGLGRLGAVAVREALRDAAAVAAITCTRRGADLPHRADLPSEQTDPPDDASFHVPRRPR